MSRPSRLRRRSPQRDEAIEIRATIRTPGRGQPCRRAARDAAVRGRARLARPDRGRARDDARAGGPPTSRTSRPSTSCCSICTLPDSAGTETVYRLRQAEPWVPIVVYASIGEVGLPLRALQAGAQDFLGKGDFECGSLIDRIRSAIERTRIFGETQRLHRELEEAERTQSLGVLGVGAALGFNQLIGAVLDHTHEVMSELADFPNRSRAMLHLLETRKAALRAIELAAHLRDYARPDRAVAQQLHIVRVRARRAPAARDDRGNGDRARLRARAPGSPGVAESARAAPAPVQSRDQRERGDPPGHGPDRDRHGRALGRRRAARHRPRRARPARGPLCDALRVRLGPPARRRIALSRLFDPLLTTKSPGAPWASRRARRGAPARRLDRRRAAIRPTTARASRCCSRSPLDRRGAARAVAIQRALDESFVIIARRARSGANRPAARASERPSLHCGGSPPSGT